VLPAYTSVLPVSISVIPAQAGIQRTFTRLAMSRARRQLQRAALYKTSLEPSLRWEDEKKATYDAVFGPAPVRIAAFMEQR
jgi:hypothetical protein